MSASEWSGVVGVVGTKMNGTAEGGVMKSETWHKHHLNFAQNSAGGDRYRQVHRLFASLRPLADAISKCGTCHISVDS